MLPAVTLSRINLILVKIQRLKELRYVLNNNVSMRFLLVDRITNLVGIKMKSSQNGLSRERRVIRDNLRLCRRRSAEEYQS